MFRNGRRNKPMKVKIDLTQGSIIKKIFIVAVPMLLASLVQMAYSLTDMFWVARVEGLGQSAEEAVAAVGTAGFLPWFGFGLIAIVKIGVSIRVSQSAGRNDEDSVNRYASNGLILMLLLAAFYMIFGIFFNKFFVGLFNIDNQTVVTEAQNYLRIVTSFGFAYFLVNLFNGVYDGLGKTINTFFVMAVGLILNMILDPLFILVLGLGVSGAALATGISQLTTLLIYVAIYLSPKRPARIKIKTYYAFNKIKDIVKLGLPVGIQSMIMTSISIGIGVMVAQYGEAVMSVSRIGSQIEALSWMVASGFQVALASFVGQNVGANQYGRVKKGYITSMAMLVPYGLAVNALLYFGARPLFKIFIDNEETLAHGIDYLKIISISQLFMILDLVTAGAFNGLGKTKIPSAIQIVGNGLRIPLALWLTGLLVPSVHGIWWAVSLSSVFKGSVLVLIFVGYILYLNKHGGLSKVENYQAL